MDVDHDFYINKEELAKYDGHALSRKAIDRIFSQIPKKLKGCSYSENTMNYEDFINFMLVEEDKTSIRSLIYWFKVLDLDDNGIITPKELE